MKTTERLSDVLICEATAQLLQSQAKITHANLIRTLRTERTMTDDNYRRLHYTMAIGEVRAYELLYKRDPSHSGITRLSE